MAATSIDYPRGVTFEEVWATLKESSAKFDREMKESSAKFDREMKESSAKFDREMDKLRESQKETDQIIKETALRLKETERLVKSNGEHIGGLHNSFGKLAEHLVAPNIKEKFNRLGFNFTKISFDVEITIDPENPESNAEVDILLENGDIVVAVEIKAKPKEKDVLEHTDRMEKLRRYADNRQDKRKFQGAVAGAIMSDAIRNYILKKGFYLIEQTGDTVKITMPEGFKPREW